MEATQVLVLPTDDLMEQLHWIRRQVYRIEQSHTYVCQQLEELGNQDFQKQRELYAAAIELQRAYATLFRAGRDVMTRLN